MKKLYYRSYQQIMKLAMKGLPWREPERIEGPNSLPQLPKYMKRDRISKVLIVTDQGIVAAGLLKRLTDLLDKEKLAYAIYDQTVANPTIENVNEAAQVYRRSNCQGIIALGGGSPIDCAKLAGASLVKEKKPIEEMKGLFKIMKSLPTFYAIPTTAGTGSEATLAAVCSNPETNEKYPVMDLSLIPDLAVLDPILTLGLPPQITAETGMDALTHAIEAYIGRSNTKETEAWSIEAVQLIMKYLYKAYEDGNDIEARGQMLRASYLAGKAFTRAYVGYVHAIAHQLGGFYQLPHGRANAIILPHVLAYYGDSVAHRLAELADAANLSQGATTHLQKAEKLIQAIKDLNERMGIATKLEEIKDEDIPIMVDRALKEAHPLYPVPKLLAADDLSQLFYQLKA